MASTFESNTGLGVTAHYNERITEQRYGGQKSTSGLVKQNAWVIDIGEIITGAPTTSNVLISGATHNLNASIPAYAKIQKVFLEVLEDITTTGGIAAISASITLGLEQADGTDIDLDGLLDATDGALTIASNNIAESRGEYKLGGSAALVPDYGTAATPGETTSIGNAAGELYALLTIDNVTGMTAAAGKFRVVVEYIDEGV